MEDFVTPMRKTLELLRGEGYEVEIVEHYNAFSRRKADLCGIWDVFGLHPDGRKIVAQTTSASNVSSRVRKITESPWLPLFRACGFSLEVHGWEKKKVGNKVSWRLRREDLS